MWCSEESIDFATAAGFGQRTRWEIAISVSELATNIVRFAGKGTITLRLLDSPAPGLEVVADDDGPGIDDVEAALKDGFSEGRFLAEEVPLAGRRGLGSGLGAVRRLMGSLSIERKPEGGTRVVAVKWLERQR